MSIWRSLPLVRCYDVIESPDKDLHKINDLRWKKTSRVSFGDWFGFATEVEAILVC